MHAVLIPPRRGDDADDDTAAGIFGFMRERKDRDGLRGLARGLATTRTRGEETRSASRLSLRLGLVERETMKGEEAALPVYVYPILVSLFLMRVLCFLFLSLAFSFHTAWRKAGSVERVLSGGSGKAKDGRFQYMIYFPNIVRNSQHDTRRDLLFRNCTLIERRTGRQASCREPK